MTKALFALIIDDNDFDLECLTAALNSSKHFSNVMCRLSGENLNDYLLGLPSLPDIILLDVNMPKIDGFEVLENLKNEPRLQNIPVIMFSSSIWEKDIERARSLNAIGYISKGTGYFNFSKAAKAIEDLLHGTSPKFHVELIY